jgi:hypothetical protein
MATLAQAIVTIAREHFDELRLVPLFLQDSRQTAGRMCILLVAIAADDPRSYDELLGALNDTEILDTPLPPMQ